MNTGVLNISDGNAVQTTSYKRIGFTRDMSLASGSQVVVGVGFKPKLVLFLACINNTPAACTGITVGDPSLAHDCLTNWHNITAEAWDVQSSQSIYMITSASAFVYGSPSSMDADGFTMGWVLQSGSPTGTCFIRATAYK